MRVLGVLLLCGMASQAMAYRPPPSLTTSILPALGGRIPPDAAKQPLHGLMGEDPMVLIGATALTQAFLEISSSTQQGYKPFSYDELMAIKSHLRSVYCLPKFSSFNPAEVALYLSGSGSKCGEQNVSIGSGTKKQTITLAMAVEEYSKAHSLEIIRVGASLIRVVQELRADQELCQSLIDSHLADVNQWGCADLPEVAQRSLTAIWCALYRYHGRLEFLSALVSHAQDAQPTDRENAGTVEDVLHYRNSIRMGFQSETFSGGSSLAQIPFEFVHFGARPDLDCARLDPDQASPSAHCKTDFNVSISTAASSRLDVAGFPQSMGWGDWWFGASTGLEEHQDAHVGIGLKVPSRAGAGTDYYSLLAQLEYKFSVLYQGQGGSLRPDIRVIVIENSGSDLNGGSNLVILEPALIYRYGGDPHSTQLRIVATLARPSASCFDHNLALKLRSPLDKNFDIEVGAEAGASGGYSHHGFTVLGILNF